MAETAPGPEEAWIAHLREHETHDRTHSEEHGFEKEYTRLQEAQLTTAFDSHRREHEVAAAQIKIALAAVDNLALVHAKAHEREHTAHDQRHADGAIAVGKAESAVDRRLEQMNEFRGQLRDQQQTFATSDRISLMQSAIDQRFETATKHTDERYEENRRRIEAIEKGDVKQEGRGLGQGAVIAIIIGAIAVASTLLGIFNTISNLAATP